MTTHQINADNANGASQDEALLARIAKDDTTAYATLVDRYLPRLWRIGVSVLCHEAEAEDVVQEVLLTVWQNRHNWKAGDTKFSTWVYRVTLNRCIDIKRRRRPTTGIETISDIMPAGTATADKLMADRQQSAQLLQMLATLPETQKRAMTLFYYEELNIKEISNRLCTTEDGARSLLKRGRKTLRELLENDNRYEYGSI